MISLEQIRYFLAIVQYSSLNNAAEHLYVSQPSLSKQLRKLEASLGCTLLKRNYSGVELTPQGKYFYEQMNNILDDFDDIVEKVSHFSEIRQLRIGGLANLVTYFLPQYMSKLQANGQNQVFVSTRLSNEELVSDVEKGALDIALLSNAEPQQNVAVIPVMTEPLYAVFPKTHPLFSQKNISFLEIATNEKLVLYKDPCTIRASIRKQCHRMKIMPNIVLELDLTESLLRYVSRGDGITLLPSIVAKNVESPTIAVREITQIPIYREISVAMKKEHVPTYLPFFEDK